VQRNFLRSLAAVLSGAAAYWLLAPHLPRFWRHHIFQLDAGLLLYILLSVLFFVLLGWLETR